MPQFRVCPIGPKDSVPQTTALAGNAIDRARFPALHWSRPFSDHAPNTATGRVGRKDRAMVAYFDMSFESQVSAPLVLLSVFSQITLFVFLFPLIVHIILFENRLCHLF